MRVDVITIFPEMFPAVLETSIVHRAQQAGILDIQVHNLRDYAKGKRRCVDDRPYGGGPGMVMMPEPLFKAVEAIRAPADKHQSCTVLMCPQGQPLMAQTAKELAALEQLVIICGRYEGVDERVREALVDREISIGDYVLTGGELPAMVLLDCVARYVPGVIGHAEATVEESFAAGLLEYPQYTRPCDFRGMPVPEVLLSGDHEAIARWRAEQAVERTRKRRPDLLQGSKEG
jgi:tRNA (guanine37-N1)-methyltransferase